MKKNNFEEGQKVYLVSDDTLDEDYQPIYQLWIGHISDARWGENSKFSKIPLQSRDYIPVEWDVLGDGGGAPNCTMIFLTKSAAIQDWIKRREHEAVEIIKDLNNQEI